jgi:hypothetical protein
MTPLAMTFPSLKVAACPHCGARVLLQDKAPELVGGFVALWFHCPVCAKRRRASDWRPLPRDRRP